MKYKNNHHYIKKSFRRYVICQNEFYTPSMQSLLQNPDDFMNDHPLKIDTTTTVSVAQIDNHRLVIKRYNLKQFWHQVKRAFSRSRAIKCWNNAHLLLKNNIDTAKPIAMIENRFGVFRRQAYFIYEFIDGEIALDFFKMENIHNPNFQIYAKKLTQLIIKMLDIYISHGDLKANNFILHQGQVYFIDLDAMQKYRLKFLFRKKRQKEIQRFLQNWDDAPVIKEMFVRMFSAPPSRS